LDALLAAKDYEDPDIAKVEQYKRWRELRKLHERPAIVPSHVAQLIRDKLPPRSGGVTKKPRKVARLRS
jgi:hypothetical protein